MIAQAGSGPGEQRRYVERASVRHPVSIAGKVLAPDLSVFVDCVVKDISAEGAMVQLTSSAAVPERVYLWQSKTSTFFECDVKWRKPGQIGLHFIDVTSRRKSLALIEQYGLGKSPALSAAALAQLPSATPTQTAKARPLPRRPGLLEQTLLGLGVLTRSSMPAAAPAPT
jgi:PilZ domain